MWSRRAWFRSNSFRSNSEATQIQNRLKCNSKVIQMKHEGNSDATQRGFGRECVSWSGNEFALRSLFEEQPFWVKREQIQTHNVYTFMVYHQEGVSSGELCIQTRRLFLLFESKFKFDDKSEKKVSTDYRAKSVLLKKHHVTQHSMRIGRNLEEIQLEKNYFI